MLFELARWDRAVKIDLGTLVAVPLGHWSSAQTWVMKMDPALDPESSPDSRRDRRISWRPMGAIEIADAPRKIGETGRLSVTLQNGDFHFAKVLPVRICVPLE